MSTITTDFKINITGTDEITDLNRQIVALKKTQSELKKNSQESSTQFVQNKENLKKLNKEYSAASKKIQTLNRYRKAETGSIKKLEAANSILRKRVKEVNLEEKNAEKRILAYNKVIDKNSALIKKNSDITSRQKQNIGNYKSALGGVSRKLSDFATPLNLAIVGIGAFGKAFSVLNQRNKLFNKVFSQTNTLFDKGVENIKELTNEVIKLSNAYEKDYTKVLEGANLLSKNFGITGVESLALIEEGFRKGADVNGDFLNQLKEYPTFFKEAGVSASEYIAITAETEKSGVFSDKGIDAIKVATVSLRELTPATRKALEGIGISSKQLEKDLKSGSKSYFQAIQQVSSKMGELEEQSPQVGTAIADIFRGAGEDAGLRYLKSLKDIKTELDELPTTLTENQEATIRLSKAWDDSLNSFSQTGGFLDNAMTSLKQFTAQALRELTDMSNGISVADRALRDGALQQANQQLGELKDTLSTLDEDEKITKINELILKSSRIAKAAAKSREKDYSNKESYSQNFVTMEVGLTDTARKRIDSTTEYELAMLKLIKLLDLEKKAIEQAAAAKKKAAAAAKKAAADKAAADKIVADKIAAAKKAAADKIATEKEQSAKIVKVKEDEQTAIDEINAKADENRQLSREMLTENANVDAVDNVERYRAIVKSKAEIDAEDAAEKEKIRVREQEKEQELLTYIEQRAREAAQINGNIRDGQLMEAEITRNKELANAGDDAAKKEEIELKFQEEQKKIRKKFANIEFAATAAEIAANTAGAISKTLFQLGGVGAMTPLGATLLGFIGAMGLSQLAVANKQRKKVQSLGKGGVLEGDSHSAPSGGIRVGDSDIFVEGKEFVVNKEATARNLPLLQAINDNGKGNSFLGNGGVLPPPISSNQTIINNNNTDSNLLASDIAAAMSTQKVYVLEKDITGTQKRVQTIENNRAW